MHIPTLLHKTFEDKLPQVHKIRLKSLMTVCEAAMTTHKCYLTHLGREIVNTNKESSNIQKVDRLLGNGHLHAERDSFYKVMILKVIQENKQPWIHIDWSCLNPVTNLYVLRASITAPGRSIVLYEACYPKSKENNHATHKAFLNKLKALLPAGIQPIIVTDAGFRGLWFTHVLQLGWHFVGRLRNKNAVRMQGSTRWTLSSTFFKQATAKATYLGKGQLTVEGKVPAHFILYKGKTKQRSTLTLRKQKRKSSKSKRYSKSHKEPWLLVTSLDKASRRPRLITTIYHQRMRIEENIRDTKCPYYGLGLKDSLTQCPQRMNILLLIVAIATLAAWLAGLFITSLGKRADFQAHSAKFNSLSYVFLGRRALKKKPNLMYNQFEYLFFLLFQQICHTQRETLQYA